MSVSAFRTSILLMASLAAAGSVADDKPASRRSAQQVSNEPISESAAKAALQFARAQHPELADLLDALRRSNQPAYQAALRDVSRDAERLNRLAERDADRHQLSLRIWNLDSRLRLAVARLSMSSDAEVESRLRPMIEDRHAARLALLEFDYQRQKERLDKLGEQLSAARRSSEDRIAAEIDRLQRLVSARSKTRSSTASPKTERSKSERSKTSGRSKTEPPAPKSSGAARKQTSGKPESEK